MRRIYLVLTFFLSCFFHLQATHIVGGELNYTCLGNDQYEITLTVFRDCYNGDPGAFFDDPASIGIFSGTTNQLLFNELVFFDPMVNDTLNPILSGACLVAPPDVCVHTTTYSTIVNLPPLKGGYILSYQRCCRNGTISNIVSPLSTGATFSVFISEIALQKCNSNAKFDTWPPIYICVNEPIEFDHSATDIDGDSIVYKLCTPLQGADTFDPQPIPPNPPPYQQINWIDPPYNENNMLNGSPGGTPLTIDPQTGMLEGLPNTIGQFVVGVCVEEYRNGELISTTRRDFQYNVGLCGETTAAFTWPEILCNDLTVNFINQSINAEEFIWDFGDPANPGPNSFDPQPSYTYPEPGIYTVTLIVEPNTVCSDTFFTEVNLLFNSLEATDLKVCSGEAFDLEYTFVGDPSGQDVVWSDANGDLINPVDVVIEHTDCQPGIYEYVVSAVCIDDPTQTITDTAQITVITNDITPFFTIIEEPCFIDVVLDSACTEFLQIVGDIPDINPGDVGSVTVEVMQTTKMVCSSETVTLNYNCACSISDLVITPGECMDGFFMVSIDFDYENTTGTFQVTDQDGDDLGIFDYQGLPVMVGPFLGDPALNYTLTVTDTELTDCSVSLDFEPLECVVACNAGTGGPICEGGTLELFEDGGDAVAWEWYSDGAAIIDPADSATPTATNVTDGEEFFVVVFGASGLTDTCSTIASVLALPVCNISADSAICTGESLVLTEDGGEAASWSWSSDGTAEIGDPTAPGITATNVANGEVFTVEITGANGCISSCSFTAVVFDLPICLAETGGPVCMGEDLILAESGGDAVMWEWSSDGTAEFDDATAQNPVASNVTDGETFTVIITDANGCVSTCTTTAQVFDLPACNASNDGPICSGEPLMLSEDGGDAVMWEWSSDGTAEFDDATAQNPVASNVTDGETFTVIITDANGCVSTCTTTTQVFDLPACIASNDGPVCGGDPLTLFEDGGDAVSWEWSSDGDAIISLPTDQNPVATNMSDGEVFTVAVTDANGCVSSSTTTAEIYDTPMVQAESNGPICEGDILILEPNLEGGTPPFSFQWSHDNGFSSANETVYIQNTTYDDGGTYYLEVVDTNGCSSQSNTFVEINGNLTHPGSIAADEYFCGPGYTPALIYEVAPPTGVPGTINFFWMKMEEDGLWEVIPGATGPTYDPGPIYVTTTYSRCVQLEGCTSVLESNVVTKTIGSEVPTDILGPTGVCLGEETAYYLLPDPTLSYQWEFGPDVDVPVTDEYWATPTFNSLGLHTISVTVSSASCTASNVLDVMVTSNPIGCSGPDPGSTDNLFDNYQPGRLQVFPNPFSDIVTIRIEEELTASGILKLSDMHGRLLRVVALQAGQRQWQMNLEEIPSGLYIILLEQAGEPVYQEKVVKR